MFDRGAEGESLTADILSALGPEWVVFHDQRWPGRLRANIDHIVLGPGGIFVIDSKNWSGDLRVDGHRLRQNGRHRERAVAAVADAALTVAEMISPFASSVRPVLCFTREEPMSGWVRDVMVSSTSTLVSMLESRELILETDQVSAAATHLDMQLRAAAESSPAPRPATPGAKPRLVTSANPRSMPDHPPPRQHRVARRTKASLGRQIAILVSGGVLYVSIPSLLPAVGDAVSEVIVGQVDDEPATCRTDSKPTAKERPAATASACD
jgi:hypothetical protein